MMLSTDYASPPGVPRLIMAVRTGHPKVLATPARVRVGIGAAQSAIPLGAWPPARRLCRSRTQDPNDRSKDQKVLALSERIANISRH
jgi:hypothetical protein